MARGGVLADQLLYETVPSPWEFLSLGILVFLWKVEWNLGKHQAIGVKGFRSQEGGPLEAARVHYAGCPQAL